MKGSKMKSREKFEAKELRRQGLSLKDISIKLGVAKSSVSIWVRDVKLTKDQISQIKDKYINSHLLGNTYARDKFKKIREEYQKEGAKKAEEKNWLHISGCMLYWAEGAKKKNTVVFVNTDLNMMKLFIKFLKTFFHVINSQCTLQIYCYDGNGILIEDIEQYWITNLNLYGCLLKKSYVKHAPVVYGKRGKLDYGTCRLVVHNTVIVQHIYGAIQKYADFNKKEWIN